MRSIFEISINVIRNNWIKLNEVSNFKASAVIKANSYGFGMTEVANALKDVGCNFFYYTLTTSILVYLSPFA